MKRLYILIFLFLYSCSTGQLFTNFRNISSLVDCESRIGEVLLGVDKSISDISIEQIGKGRAQRSSVIKMDLSGKKRNGKGNQLLYFSVVDQFDQEIKVKRAVKNLIDSINTKKNREEDRWHLGISFFKNESYRQSLKVNRWLLEAVSEYAANKKIVFFARKDNGEFEMMNSIKNELVRRRPDLVLPEIYKGNIEKSREPAMVFIDSSLSYVDKNSKVITDSVGRNLNKFLNSEIVKRNQFALSEMSIKDYQKSMKIRMRKINEKIEKIGIGKVQIKKNEIERLNREVDKSGMREYLNETLFIIPSNDIESIRVLQILEVINAPYVKISNQEWGAHLDNESFNSNILDRVKNVVIMEIPGVEKEKKLIELGKSLKIIDHHEKEIKGVHYKRWNPLSSLEQMGNLLGIKLDKISLDIAHFDSGYIQALKFRGLTKREIMDLIVFGQGMNGITREELTEIFNKADKIIPTLKQLNGIYVISGQKSIKNNYIVEKLAIDSSDGIVNVLMFEGKQIRFSGSSKIVDKIKKIEFHKILENYNKKDYRIRFGGDEISAIFSLFVKKKIKGQKEYIPERIVEEVERAIFDSNLL